MLTFNPSIAVDWDKSRALPFAIPSATSNKTTSPNSFRAIK